MSNLHHWDATETFSAQQAAALVVGIDPLDPQAALWKAGPVLEQMKEGHRIGRVFATQVMTSAQFEMQRKLKNWADALVSVLFDNYPMLQKNPWPSDPNRPYELPARFAGPDGEFNVQKFARAEIQRWLSIVGIRSVYQFDRKQLHAIPFQAGPAAAMMAETTSAGASSGLKPDKTGPVIYKAETVPDRSAPPMVALGASCHVSWKLVKPKKIQGYGKPLCDLLKAAYVAGQPIPTAREVLEIWRKNPPPEVAKLLADSMDYYDALGQTKSANLEAIRKAIGRMSQIES